MIASLAISNCMIRLLLSESRYYIGHHILSMSRPVIHCCSATMDGDSGIIHCGMGTRKTWMIANGH